MASSQVTPVVDSPSVQDVAVVVAYLVAVAEAVKVAFAVDVLVAVLVDVALDVVAAVLEAVAVALAVLVSVTASAAPSADIVMVVTLASAGATPPASARAATPVARLDRKCLKRDMRSLGRAPPMGTIDLQAQSTRLSTWRANTVPGMWDRDEVGSRCEILGGAAAP